MKRYYIAIWIIFYLAIFDILINIIFHYPKDPQNVNPSFLQSYFEYGRSVEGKLQGMTRLNEDEAAPIVNGGWLETVRQKSLPSKRLSSDTSKVVVSLYGMSHTEELWKSISKLDKRYLIRGFMAAGATPNWSYAAYESDEGKEDSDVVILGIMTDSVPLITSTTGMTAYFDMSYPYTFPRYTVKGDKVNAVWPPFYDSKNYVKYFFDKAKWKQYRAWLAKNDKYYNPILFKKSILDYSALFRLVRRAYAEREKQKIINSSYTKAGFIEDSEEVIVLRTIVKNFAESAREKSIIPIIYIVNNQERSDHLFKILKPVLDSNKIPYLSSHVICPPDDPRVFLSINSHFIHSKDMELAQEMIKIIQQEIEKKKKS